MDLLTIIISLDSIGSLIFDNCNINQSNLHHIYKSSNQSKNIIHTKIVGVSFCNCDGKSRQDLLKLTLPDDKLTLKRDPYNKYDNNCINVCNQHGFILGHLSKELAAKLASRMDNNLKLTSRVLAVTGGNDKYYGCNIEISF